MAKKRKYMVLARNQKIQESGLVTGKGHRVFGEKSAMWISDPAEAREIDHEYGMKGKKLVSVTTDQQYEWSVNNDGSNGTRMDNIHNYTFQGVDWKRAGGNVRVKVRTADGVSYVSLQIAKEEGLEIVSEKKRVARRAKRREVDEDE